MRVLILGASGLIGHRLFLELRNHFNTFGLLHRSRDAYQKITDYLGADNLIDNVDIIDFEKLQNVLTTVKPQVILNCTGITRRKKEINDPVTTLEINTVLPHKLANWAKLNNTRIIHFSTDCVFDGNAGNYTEDSPATATDFYGRSKALGEIRYDYTLTIRSSFIGQELYDKTELLEWFLAQKDKKIKGFSEALYSGVSTIFLARVVKKIISDFPGLSGLYQLALEKPISKYELLCIAKEAFKVNISIIKDDTYRHYPTLNGSRLHEVLKMDVPSWPVMMEELANNREFYAR